MTIRNLAIIGTGSHYKVIRDAIDTISKNIHPVFENIIPTNIGINENQEKITEFIEKHQITSFFVAIGDNYTRYRVIEKIETVCPKLELISVMHPDATWSESAEIMPGTTILPGSVIAAETKIGKGCIIGHNCTVEAETVIGHYSSLAPGVHIGNNCYLGEFVFMGINSSAHHGTFIGDNVVVGAASFVKWPIDPNLTVFGIPAKAVKTRQKGDKYL